MSRGVVEDVGGLGHLDHERRAATGEIVARADTREDAVERPEHASSAGTKLPTCASSAISADWRMYVRLAAHVRAR